MVKLYWELVFKCNTKIAKDMQFLVPTDKTKQGNL